jgi:peptidoglycan/xylan/chitin deacetylase (PgdA/CDA1 family)
MSPVFTCSIDDGHPLDMKTAELLHKHGLNATFFIPIRNCEGDSVLIDAQVRELGRRFEIGSHTYDHCYLKSVDVREAYHQIHDGKRLLEDLLGTYVNGFCYPGGRYGPRDVALVKACQFSYARTTMNLCFDAGIKPYEMPTTVQFYPHDAGVYLRNFAGSGDWARRAGGLWLAVRHPNWIDRLYAMFDHACDHGGVFHLWGHSRQIEELNAWHEIDAFFRHAAARVTPAERLSNAQLAARVPLIQESRVVESI